ncbi:elongation factor G [Christensenellaceae bacterium OttesenSCG-928-L17]|nr:elongation factor G [Christensenellaceae bacterium OttesenSCG-928-L17]
MKDYPANKIRNIGIFGHGGEGKTTLTEAMLFNAGLLDRMGRVEDGSTVTDYDPEEIKRTISIGAAVAPFEWNNTKVNIIDAPGFFDFYGEVVEAMALADSALIVVGSVSGPVVGVEKAMDMCKKSGKARMMVVNQMDRENANFMKTYEAITAKFGPSCVAIQLPIVEGGVFKGYVDIIDMKAKLFDGKGEKSADIPAALQAEAEALREALIEAAAESDEALMGKYFEGEELSQEEIRKGVCAGVRDGGVTPICCCAAQPNIGVRTLVDNLLHFMPTADQVPARKAKDVKSGNDAEIKLDGKFAAQVMKTVADPFVGKISILKIYSGALTTDLAAYNPNAEKSEKPGTIYIMRGKKMITVDKLQAGDIGAMAKLQYTNTGDTLCDSSAQVRFEDIQFPQPCISLAVTAKKQGEEDKIIAGLNRLKEEDPTMSLEKNAETGDVLISGLGEMHIDVMCAKLKNKFNVEAQLVEPRVPYRETIRGKAEAEGKHKKQTGGSGQFGVVQMRFEPLEDGDFEFVNAIVGGVVPKEYVPAVEKGTREALQKGVLAGYPMVGVKATLYDGKYHPVDSKEVAFKSAARLAYKAACVKASPALIEPIYRVEVLVPDEYMGDVIGDMNRRRGRVIGMNPAEGGQEVVAEAPLSEVFKYATDLRAMTQARGSFKMEFVRYEDVPANIAQKIIEQAKRDDEEDE